MNWFSKLKQGLAKTAALFSFGHADEAGLEELEEALIRADAGWACAREITDAVRAEKPADGAALYATVKALLVAKIKPYARELKVNHTRRPAVILMIGVNGAGKTTTIGKLAQSMQAQGLKVAMVAGDTFRAGATEQLARWSERLNCRVYRAGTGADAAGLVFDAMKQSREAGDDVLFVDTAGRLQNRTDLMDELKKIKRVIQKQDPSAPHEVILVLDATGGQNALQQVKVFQEAVGLTGLIMTKLDGTAKGGILIPLGEQYHLPIYALGVGEQADDLRPFTAEEYVESLLGERV